MTTRLVSTFGLAALALAGCTSDLTTAPNQQDPARSFERSAPAVAFSGRCNTNFNPAEFEPTPTGLHVIVHGTCYLSHLGESDLYIDQIADFAAGTLVGTAVYTAANGDKVYSSFAGALLAPVGPVQPLDATSTITGGTGRFTGAAGTGQITGAANLATNTGGFRYDGSITY